MSQKQALKASTKPGTIQLIEKQRLGATVGDQALGDKGHRACLKYAATIALNAGLWKVS